MTQKIRAVQDHILVSNMNFGDQTTASGIVLQSDNGKSHGIYPRWGKVYAVGDKQTDVKIGQWILVEHGRWTRDVIITDENNINHEIRRVENEAILVVSDEPPNPDDIRFGIIN